MYGIEIKSERTELQTCSTELVDLIDYHFWRWLQAVIAYDGDITIYKWEIRVAVHTI